MHNGPIPKGKIVDHINHIRHDNRLCNLRLVSSLDNARNISKSTKTPLGVQVYILERIVVNGVHT